MIDGKCKVDFEKWLNTRGNVKTENINSFKMVPFSDYPFEMQSGVYLAFFDSVGIIIDTPIYRQADKSVLTDGWITIQGEEGTQTFAIKSDMQITRTEALTEAIKQANIIYNK